MRVDHSLVSFSISIQSRIHQDQSRSCETISCETVSETDIRSISARTDESEFARADSLWISDSGTIGTSHSEISRYD